MTLIAEMQREDDRLAKEQAAIDSDGIRLQEIQFVRYALRNAIEELQGELQRDGRGRRDD